MMLAAALPPLLLPLLLGVQLCTAILFLAATSVPTGKAVAHQMNFTPRLLAPGQQQRLLLQVAGSILHVLLQDVEVLWQLLGLQFLAATLASRVQMAA